MISIQEKRQRGYDVIVVGGGIAGISAAVSCAREGKKVLLIEKHINLGGLATSGLISWFEPLCDGAGRQMVAGVGQELLQLAVRCGFDNLNPKWGGKGKNKLTSERYASFFSPTFFSLKLDEWVRQNGVELLFDTLATHPVMDGKMITGVLVENIDGCSIFPAKIVIDATGDASIAQKTGVPTQEEKNVMTYIVHDMNYESAKKYTDTHDLSQFRHWQWLKPSEDTLYGANSKTINEYLRKSKATALQYYENTDKDERDIFALPFLPQIRVIRHLVGDVTFEAGAMDQKTLHSIGSIADFRGYDRRYDIPYECLYHSDFPNLLCAGRIVSAEKEGMEVLRVLPGCCLTGQAAGIAASLAIENGNDVHISYQRLHERLKSQNVLFEI